MNDDPVLRNDWYVVAASRDLAEGGVVSARLLGEDLVLWRSGDKVMAWKDLCIHRGAKLSYGWVKEGQLICPYHGWHYNCEAVCTLMPAHPQRPPPSKARAVAYKVTEAYDLIWVALGEPEKDVPDFPEWTDASFRKVLAGPYDFHANPFRTVENFLDVSHFPFVHAHLNGDPDNPDVIDKFDVFKDEEGIRTSEIMVNQPYGDHRGGPVKAGYTFNCPRPLTAYFSKNTGDGNRFCTFLTVTPLAPDDCIVWLQVAINFGEELTEEQILARQDKVFNQDKRIVETQRPYEIPLDLREELHAPSDLYLLEYRRWLREMGVTWGVGAYDAPRPT